MPKVSNRLKEIKKALHDACDLDVFYSSIEKDDHKLREFLCLFESVEDSRMPKKCTYTTTTIIGIVFFGLLCGMDSWVEIAFFAKKKRSFLKRYLELPDTIPSHDTLERVFSLLDSETLEDTFVRFLQKAIQRTAEILSVEEGISLLAIDGKELNGSGRKYNTDEKIKNKQIMHFYDTSTNICIRSSLIEEKTNEIPTAQKF